MKRGDFVVVTIQGDYGKPRPALVVQSDLVDEHSGGVTVAPVTTTIAEAPLFRITVEPSAANGLRSVSQVMVDKLTTVRRNKVGPTIGHLDADTLTRVNRAILVWLGIAP